MKSLYNTVQGLQVLAISYASKGLGLASRTLKRGRGTSISGLFIEKYFKNSLSFFNHRYDKIIFISGTNGKTTTRSILVKIFEDAGHKVCSNIGGANIFRGIASSFMSDLDSTGKVKSDVAIIEVEEATLPNLTKLIQPDHIILTNIFRDQLDAYGELEKTIEYFTIAADYCPESKIIINYDDAKLVEGMYDYKKQFIGFGLDKQLMHDNYEKSESKIKFKNDYTVNKTKSGLDINKEGFTTKLPGNYNLYNIVASYASAELAGVDNPKMMNSIAEYQPPFGRGEVVEHNGKTINIFLVKNPAGFNQVLEHINNQDENSLLCASINDKIADGKDVSWLWDVDMEKHQNDKAKVQTGGVRGLDMLFRLQVAGYKVSEEDYHNSADKYVNAALESEHENIYFCATYTSLFEVRESLQRYVDLPQIDDEGN